MLVVSSGCGAAVEGENADESANEADGDQGAELDESDPGAEVDATSEALSLPWGWWWRRDAGVRDAGGRDASTTASDAGAPATHDAAVDAGSSTRDAGVVDAGSTRDAAVAVVDAAVRDASADANARDASVADASTRDAGSAVADAGGPVLSPGRSAGCGRAASGNDAFDNRSKSVNGTNRTYHVRVPASYDKDRAYPVVFRWHGTGGNGLSGGLDIQYASGANAIIVGADGINSGWTYGTEPNDLALFDAMLDELSQQYCVDLGRVYAYGFSAGGGITNALSCKRASKLRGSAAIAGFDRGDASCDGTQVAAWFQHDVTDPAVSITQGRASRDRAIRRNGCTTQTTAVNGCVSYSGCKTGFPVIWCETNGLGHDIAGGTAPARVWEFFSTLP